MASLMRMSPRLRIRRPLSMKRSRAVDTARHIVAHGLVDSGSPWDGLHIRDVYKLLRPLLTSAQAAYDITALVWRERAQAYRAGAIDWEASTRREEPWSYEEPIGFWEDES